MNNFLKSIIGQNKTIYFILDYIRKRSFFKARFNHLLGSFSYRKSRVSRANKLSDDLVQKIVQSVEKDIKKIPSGQWKLFYQNYHREIIENINNKNFDQLSDFFQNPLTNNLFYGFDNLSKELDSSFRIETIYECESTCDAFVSLAEYLGIIKVINPEFYNSPRAKRINIESLVYDIINYLNLEKNRNLFLNPFNGEKGIYTKYGVASSRVPQSLYEACRVTSFGKKICEIGPGMGRTAYFSVLMGAEQYFMVDLPISSMSQSYFLLNHFKIEEVALNNEDIGKKKIKLMGVNEFKGLDNYYDVIINVDSLTEMGIETAMEYLSLISKKTKFFLSINHESNEINIRDMVKEFPNFKLLNKQKSWTRKGYLEEVYQILN